MDDDLEPSIKDEITLFGIPASPGVAHGQVFRFLHEELEVLNNTIVSHMSLRVYTEKKNGSFENECLRG